MKLEKILKSKGLYYVALVLMIVNVLGYVSMGSIECIVVFAISYYLSNSYTKNQSVDILVGLFVANVVFGCGRVKEGYEGLENKVKKAASDAATEEKKEKNNACKPGKHRNAAGKCVAKAKLASHAKSLLNKAADMLHEKKKV